MNVTKLVGELAPILQEYYVSEEQHQEAKMLRDTKIMCVMGKAIFDHWLLQTNDERDARGKRLRVKECCHAVSKGLHKKLKLDDHLLSQEAMYGAFMLAAELTPMQLKAVSKMSLGRSGVQMLALRKDRQKLVESYDNGKELRRSLAKNREGRKGKGKGMPHADNPLLYMDIEFRYSLYDLNSEDKREEIENKAIGLVSQLPEPIRDAVLRRLT